MQLLETLHLHNEKIYCSPLQNLLHSKTEKGEEELPWKYNGTLEKSLQKYYFLMQAHNTSLRFFWFAGIGTWITWGWAQKRLPFKEAFINCSCCIAPLQNHTIYVPILKLNTGKSSIHIFCFVLRHYLSYYAPLGHVA